MTRILLIKELSKSEILSMRQGDHSPGLKPKKNYCYTTANFSVGWLTCIPAIWKSKLVAEHSQSNIRSAIKKPLGITCRTGYYTLLAPLIRPETAQSTSETSLNLCDPDCKKNLYVTTVNNNRIIITLFPVQKF